MMFNNTGNYVSSTRPHNSIFNAAGAATPGDAAIPYPLLHQHHVRHQIMVPFSHSPSSLPYPASSGGGGAGEDDFPMRDERFPQWTNQETRDLIEIRGRFERGKNLWETVANRMREKGYRRTPDQCKSKWESLVSRYMELETSHVDNSNRHCPFFDELHLIFTARANLTQPPHRTADHALTNSSKTLETAAENQSHEEFSQEPENEQETEPEQTPKTRIPPKRKPIREKRQKTAENKDHPLPSRNNENVLHSLHEMMRTFIMSQQRMDMQWRESMEKYTEERDQLEDEWRKKMESLERERLTMERAFREREEQRRLKEESRAEKRDALLTELLNKLVRDETQ